MVNKVLIRKATVGDCLYIAKHMRDADQKEIWYSHRQTPIKAMMACYLLDCLCALVNDRPTVLFGCTNGVPWMLATDDIKKVGVRFILASKDYVLSWLDQYKVLSNYVHADNEVSIRWLKWLGFNMLETVLINNERFIKFEMKEVQ